MFKKFYFECIKSYSSLETENKTQYTFLVTKFELGKISNSSFFHFSTL